jgi:uncharacterized protein
MTVLLWLLLLVPLAAAWLVQKRLLAVFVRDRAVANRIGLTGAELARERSVAALGIAGHEVSHAYQDAAGSRA